MRQKKQKKCSIVLNTFHEDRLDKETFEAVRIYFEAHQMLPEEFFEDPVGAQMMIDMALAMLGAQGERGQRLEAQDLLYTLVVLGHAGSEEALDALIGYAASGGMYAAVAKMAVSECSGLLQERRMMRRGAA